MPKGREVNVLLVEDDEIDVRAIQRAFRKLRVAGSLTVAKDGIEGWAALQHLKRPYLIVLDINLPRMNGLELLRMIRHDDNLRDSIVFVLTTSTDDKARFDAYKLNVAGYIRKSDMGANLIRAAEMVAKYREVVAFPGGE